MLREAEAHCTGHTGPAAAGRSTPTSVSLGAKYSEPSAEARGIAVPAPAMPVCVCCTLTELQFSHYNTRCPIGLRGVRKLSDVFEVLCNVSFHGRQFVNYALDLPALEMELGTVLGAGGPSALPTAFPPLGTGSTDRRGHRGPLSRASRARRRAPPPCRGVGPAGSCHPRAVSMCSSHSGKRQHFLTTQRPRPHGAAARVGMPTLSDTGLTRRTRSQAGRADADGARSASRRWSLGAGLASALREL